MPRVLVIGAGMAGLLAAGELRRRGCTVTVIDKGHQPGGRVATRRVGDATFDIGAQFFTTKGQRFADLVAEWRQRRVAAEWFRGAPDDVSADSAEQDRHPRFRGHPTMRDLARDLTGDLDVRLARRVTGASPAAGSWRVTSVAREDPADVDELLCDGLLCTAPVPQSLEVLAEGEVVLSGQLRRELATITYAPTLAAMALPRRTPRLGHRGALRLSRGPVAFLSDNQAKGVSRVPAVTLHASEELSRRRWTDDDAAIADELLAAAHPWLGDDAEVVAIHRWRYATPHHLPPTEKAPARLDLAPLPLAFAGDAFTGGRVEGAATSGLAAAELLADALTAR